MLALVRHHCPCGQSYIVSLAGDEDLERHPRWNDGAAETVNVGGDVLVDGRAAGFFCSGCSRLHLRVGPPIVHPICVENNAEWPYAFTLN